MGVNAIIDSAHLYFQSPLLQKYVRFNTTLRNNLSCENKAQQGFDERTQQNILVVFENPPFPYGLQTSKTHFNLFTRGGKEGMPSIATNVFLQTRS